MNEPSDTSKSESLPNARRAPRWRLFPFGAAVGIVAYLLIAYVAMPAYWENVARRHPAIDEAPGVTVTGNKHPGDPLNVALVGSESQLKNSMEAAGWLPADPLSIKSDLKIAADTVLDRPYKKAPVSSLYLWGRKEDLAFEFPVGKSPGKRHHVRFWKSAQVDAAGRPAWFGSATYDERVGLSHTTGQVTHHISADVDAERDFLFAALKKAGGVKEVQVVEDFHKVRQGKNGGGDPWRTDGRLFIAELK
jgi:hypothetical protein